MDPLTHLATGVICSQLLPAPSRWWAAMAGAIFAVLPDVDYILIFWDRLAFIRYHRGFTHSLAALPLFALAGALLGQALGGPRWFKPLFILGLVVLLSHLLLDLATSYGTQILSPFSGRRLALDWLFIIDPYFTALLLIGAIGPWPGPAGGLGREPDFWLPPGSICWCAPPTITRPWIWPAGYLRMSNPEPRPWPLCPNPFPAAAGNSSPWARPESGRPLSSSPLRPPWGLSRSGNGGGGCRRPERALPRRQPFLTRPPATLPSRSGTRPGRPQLSIHRRLRLSWRLSWSSPGFPCSAGIRIPGGGQLLEWLDLRFSIPGRRIPFVLQLRLDAQGRLQQWLIGQRR